MFDEWMVSILARPGSDEGVLHEESGLRYEESGDYVPLVNGVPTFRVDGEEVKIMDPDHESNSWSAEVRDLFADPARDVLNIGAGSTPERFPRCVEMEYTVFRHTSVVGDAHHLPFRSNSFDVVVSLNTFEHLRDPQRAAAEIYRVLRPGGEVFIHSAFLQPLHEAPHHYYNATEFGIRNWFTEFTIDSCQVSKNFSPEYALGMQMIDLIHVVQEELGEEAAGILASTTLGNVAQFWAGRHDQPFVEVLQQLPESAKRPFAAGFELKGRKQV